VAGSGARSSLLAKIACASRFCCGASPERRVSIDFTHHLRPMFSSESGRSISFPRYASFSDDRRAEFFRSPVRPWDGYLDDFQPVLRPAGLTGANFSQSNLLAMSLLPPEIPQFYLPLDAMVRRSYSCRGSLREVPIFRGSRLFENMIPRHRFDVVAAVFCQKMRSPGFTSSGMSSPFPPHFAHATLRLPQFSSPCRVMIPPFTDSFFRSPH